MHSQRERVVFHLTANSKSTDQASIKRNWYDICWIIFTNSREAEPFSHKFECETTSFLTVCRLSGANLNTHIRKLTRTLPVRPSSRSSSFLPSFRSENISLMDVFPVWLDKTTQSRCRMQMSLQHGINKETNEQTHSDKTWSWIKCRFVQWLTDCHFTCQGELKFSLERA